MVPLHCQVVCLEICTNYVRIYLEDHHQGIIAFPRLILQYQFKLP